MSLYLMLYSIHLYIVNLIYAYMLYNIPPYT